MTNVLISTFARGNAALYLIARIEIDFTRVRARLIAKYRGGEEGDDVRSRDASTTAMRYIITGVRISSRGPITF